MNFRIVDRGFGFVFIASCDSVDKEVFLCSC